MSTLAPLLEKFFTHRLVQQCGMSSNTVSAYRDTFRLLLCFAQEFLRKAPAALELADLDANFIVTFLQHLETKRNNIVRSRNARLAAIHSFFKYIALYEPQHSELIQRVLAIPQKRTNRKLVTFLSQPEIDAILLAPDHKTWIGRRDYTLLLVAIQTGLRVSELISLRQQDAVLKTPPHLRCTGKGRKERCTPLTKQTVAVLKTWLHEINACPSDLLFPNRQGGPLNRDTVQWLLNKYVAAACSRCSTLNSKRVSPHVLRHTAAVRLLQAGVDRSVIALWLGHESIETTQIYLNADLAIKERALSHLPPQQIHFHRFKPNDKLLAFLSSL